MNMLYYDGVRTMSQNSTSKTFLPAKSARPDSTVEPDMDPLPARQSALDLLCWSWRCPLPLLLLLMLLLLPLELDRFSTTLAAPFTKSA